LSKAARLKRLAAFLLKRGYIIFRSETLLLHRVQSDDRLFFLDRRQLRRWPPADVSIREALKEKHAIGTPIAGQESCQIELNFLESNDAVIARQEANVRRWQNKRRTPVSPRPGGVEEERESIGGELSKPGQACQ
jgi:hypothetical protein